MTSVLSLTVGASADYTFATSTLLACEGQSFSAINLEQFTQLGGEDIGAMWTSDATTVNSLVSATWTTMRYGSLAYDTGSWTDANSNGLFIIPNDKWQYVEIGANFLLGSGVTGDGATRILPIVLDNTSTPYPYQTYEAPGVTTIRGINNHVIAEVSSGEVWAAQAYVTAGGYEWQNVIHAYWIRGIKPRG